MIFFQTVMKVEGLLELFLRQLAKAWMLWSRPRWNCVQWYIWLGGGQLLASGWCHLSEINACSAFQEPTSRVFPVAAHLWRMPPPVPGFTHCAGVCFATHDLRVVSRLRMKSSCHEKSDYLCCWCAFGISSHAKLWREGADSLLSPNDNDWRQFVFLLPEQINVGKSATGRDRNQKRKSPFYWLPAASLQV